MLEENQFLKWFAEVLAVSNRSLSLTDTRETVNEWDSLGSLLILMRFEEDYRIVIEATEIEQLESIGDLYSLYRERLPKSL